MVAASKKRRDATIVPLELFPSHQFPPTPAAPLQKEPRKGFNDPAFASNKSLPIHRWVPWIAGFSASFVKDALHTYLPRKGIVLDPFAGVGTTLVEAILAGHEAIGFEINPYAAFVSQVKTSIVDVDVPELIRTIADFRACYAEKLASNHHPQSVSPPGFKSRAAFYSPLVLRKVLIVQDFIQVIASDTLRRLFQMAFAATMVSYSNYSYEPSLGRRVSSGKSDIIDFAVDETICAKLDEIATDIMWFLHQRPLPAPHARVIHSSFFASEHHLAPESVDCIITSPPYLNNYHYNRNTRPHLYWLGLVETPADLNALEESNFGKYWQTVRNQPPLALDFVLPHTDLAERIAEIRGCNTERGIYGGNGWANYAATYFNDCFKLALGMKNLLKPGGTALIVIGNSILQGVFIPTDTYFAQIAVAVGLELVEIHTPRATRVGNSIIKSKVRVAKAQEQHQLYEAVVELRQPR